MAVPHDLAGLRPAGAEAHAVDHAIQAAFQVGQHHIAGDAFGQRGLLEVVAELGFQQAIDAAGLLLLAQLQAVADQLGLAVFTMLPGDEVAFFDGALFGVAALAFQEYLHALAPAKPAYRADVSCQCSSPYLSLLTSLLKVQFTVLATFVLLDGTWESLDPTFLRRPASVVRNRGDVLDLADFDSGCG